MPEKIIQVNQHMFETKLDRMVSEKVNEILNAMLDAEADELAGAGRYERSDGRKAYRAGHYERDLTLKAGKLSVKVPKLKGAVFESAVIERLNRETRRRTRVVGAFPDGKSALMLISARIRYVTANDWSTRHYLDMSRLQDTMNEANRTPPQRQATTKVRKQSGTTNRALPSRGRSSMAASTTSPAIWKPGVRWRKLTKPATSGRSGYRTSKKSTCRTSSTTVGSRPRWTRCWLTSAKRHWI
jgi:hypothetical protein